MSQVRIEAFVSVPPCSGGVAVKRLLKEIEAEFGEQVEIVFGGRDQLFDLTAYAAMLTPFAGRTGGVSEEGVRRYVDFLVPGLIGMNLMSAGMWGVGYALVDMRIKKLLRRLLRLPLRPEAAAAGLGGGRAAQPLRRPLRARHRADDGRTKA